MMFVRETIPHHCFACTAFQFCFHPPATVSAASQQQEHHSSSCVSCSPAHTAVVTSVAQYQAESARDGERLQEARIYRRDGAVSILYSTTESSTLLVMLTWWRAQPLLCIAWQLSSKKSSGTDSLSVTRQFNCRSTS